jgi:hypothetical protein
LEPSKRIWGTSKKGAVFFLGIAFEIYHGYHGIVEYSLAPWNYAPSHNVCILIP